METKAITIIGPTSSGKSDLAIILANKFGGEIISADSRQVYQHMDIGTGKVTKTEQRLAHHYLLDVVHPANEYNVAAFLRDAKETLTHIRKRNLVPIVCGGTGFWAQSLIEDRSYPIVPPNPELRGRLARFKTETLYKRLEKKDPARAEAIGEYNRVYLIRAIEIAEALGKVPPLSRVDYRAINRDWLILALAPDKDLLHKRIEERLDHRIRRGMVAETKRLYQKHGVSWNRLEAFGLEYKWTALHLQGKISKEEMRDGILQDNKSYAKRQMTWLKRWKRMGAHLRWITTQKEGIALTKKFLK